MTAATDLDQGTIEKAYARWAPVYDLVFGAVFDRGRQAAIAAAERIGGRILEVGVGTGISLPDYASANRITGVDISVPMLKKARENAGKIGVQNVEFRLGELEHLPVADNTADVILSNCVINLVPDKTQVFREAFRTLKPGGRLAISDVVNKAPLPAKLQADRALLCGCIAGAATIAETETWLAEAGFVDVRVTPKAESRELISTWAPGSGIEDFVVSAMVGGRKPARV